jgi:hypothetical protein
MQAERKAGIRVLPSLKRKQDLRESLRHALKKSIQKQGQANVLDRRHAPASERGVACTKL